MLRGSGEGWSERCRYELLIAASKTKQQEHSDPVSTMATTGYHGLLRPSTRNSRCHTQPCTRPDAIHTTYSSPQTRTGKHCSMGRAQLARQHCCSAHGLSFVKIGLENACWSTSSVRPRLTDLIATPLQTELHPFQMPRRNVITALLIEAATSSAR